MEWIRRFGITLALWAIGLSIFLIVTGAGGSGTPWSLGARIPGFVGFGLVLACFPAGVSVGAEILRSPKTFVREGVALTALVLVLMGTVFVVVQYLAPSALAGGRAESVGVEVQELTLPELREYVREVVRIAEEGPESDLGAWRTANLAFFEHDRRLAHASLPFFLTWLGALGGFWAARLRHRQLRIVQLLAMGLFLLVSIYLGGENGYELVAARMAGQAYFAAWFIPLAPAILGLGLGWPTLVAVFTEAGEDEA